MGRGESKGLVALSIARLWTAPLGGTRRAVTVTPPQLFSPRRAAAQAARASANGGDDVFGGLIAESLLDRLTMVTRRFDHALLLAAQSNPLSASLAPVADHVTLQPGPDQLSQEEAGQFDLIVWPGGMESIDDVPGALVRLRRALRPDGLLVGALAGDGSFPMLRRLLASEGMRAIPRMHPQIALKAMGDLLQRTGFALPVADVEDVGLRYRNWRQLVADLRAAGLASRLLPAPPPLTRAELAALDAAFADVAGAEGRAEERVRLIFFSGWAPHPDQPKAARRGSATGSLAAALRDIGERD